MKALNVCSVPMTPPSPPAIQSVLELFKGPLASVRFADVDAAGLANLAAEVESAADEVNGHEAKLAQLRQELVGRQEALLLLAQRALAYARVFAENDDALLEELNRIALPRAAKARKPSASATKTTNADDAAAPALTAEATPAAETATESVEPDAPSRADEPAETKPARPTKKIAKGRLSRAFSREDSA